MSHEYACEGCFADKELIEWIKENGKPGPCSWCGSRRKRRVPISELGDLFRDATRIYEVPDYPPDDGDFIWDLLQHDWDVFSERIVDSCLQELALAILYAGIDPKELVDFPDYGSLLRRKYRGLEDEWHDRVARLFTRAQNHESGHVDALPEMHPDISQPPEWFALALEDLSTTLNAGQPLFRARVHESRTRRARFEAHQLSAPPPENARAGRASPKGVPVLYAATDAATALAEVRAWRGAAVAIADLALARIVHVVDIREGPPISGPFFDELLEWKLQIRPLFERFADDLSRPVMPDDEIFQYLPSQLLCRLIKEAGYDGVIYPSSLGPGANIVLFDPSIAAVARIRYVRIASISLDAEALDDGDQPYEDWPYDYLVVDDPD